MDDNDSELLHGTEAPAQVAGRDLHDVERHHHAHAADRESADEAEPAEGVRPDRLAHRRERAPDGRNEEERPHQPERRAAAPFVRRRARREHADDGADQRARHDEPVPESAEAELRLDGLFAT